MDAARPWAELAPWPVRLPVPQADAWTVTARLALHEASDALPLRAMEGDWARYRPRDGRQVAAQHVRVEVVAARAGWEFAAHRGSEALLTGSRDAYDLVHAYKRRAEPAAGTTFDARVLAHGAQTTGVRLAHSGRFGWGRANEVSARAAGWRWSLGATVLHVHRSLAAELRGSARYGAGGPEAFEGSATRHDSGKQFGGFGNAGAAGQGFSVDAGLSWRGAGGLAVDLSLVDVVSRLELDRVAAQTLALSSQVLSYDADGYLAYRPALTGRNSAARVRTELLRKTTLAVDRRVELPGLGDTRLGLRWVRIGSLDTAALTFGHSLCCGLSGVLEWDPRFQGIGLGLTGRAGALMLRTSVGSDTRSHVRGGQLTWAWTLR